jgi:hypothetical protein
LLLILTGQAVNCGNQSFEKLSDERCRAPQIRFHARFSRAIGYNGGWINLIAQAELFTRRKNK